MPRIALFALRRTLPPWLLAGLIAVLLLAAHASARAPLVELGEHANAELRGLARQNVWSVLLVAAPFLLAGAARLGADGERLWLAPTPAPRCAVAAALALGCALAAALATLATAVVAESARSAEVDAWTRTATLANPPSVLHDGAPAVAWTLETPAAGRLRLWTTVAVGSGPAVTARFTARAAASEVAVERRVAGRTALELDVPPPDVPPDGPLELRLERLGPGALLVLPADALERLAPAPGVRRAALAVGTRVGLLLAAGCALALGLGRRLRPALAAAVVLALALLACGAPRAWPWIPGADLPLAWRDLGAGLVPAPPPLGTLAGALVLGVLGVAAYAWSAREVRR